jgi:hypothetical protein
MQVGHTTQPNKHIERPRTLPATALWPKDVLLYAKRSVESWIVDVL